MTTHPKKSFDFLSLYQKFINDTKRGLRLQPNGKRISIGTIKNYCHTGILLERFCQAKQFELRIRPVRRLNQRELNAEKKYWKKFYLQFTSYLYNDLDCYDNYTGSVIKHIRSFFNYLNKELALGCGDFHKLFYVRNEAIAIFPLLPEELNYLIYDKTFEAALKHRMKEVKDFFVFGCTVALRFSDLASLQKSNLRVVNNQHYLSVRSKKTNTDTLIRLPEYAVAIIQRYHKLKKRLLPAFNNTNLNKFIKLLLEQAGFNNPVQVTRGKRGMPLLQKKKQNTLRFCDVATTHTMRRTAITTMLSLGMPEQVVRKISGHAPGSKEFYRYVLWSQTYQDQETEKMFERLEGKKLEIG
ncbi:MAG: tyrosine-type recombinase/integrase [Bacteroidetes bacterium]|nr:tyrosine-type recombinase/integrase [Bacteroidota bacterium]